MKRKKLKVVKVRVKAFYDALNHNVRGAKDLELFITAWQLGCECGKTKR